MANTHEIYLWQGEYPFMVSGTNLHEDTLRIRNNYMNRELNLTLVLPTLCITYADMAFQNTIGGEQARYPASATYGPTYFNPPVDLVGEEMVERFTYIRGAHRVVISPEKTFIHFFSWKELVIPRLRIQRDRPSEASIQVPETEIQVNTPLRLSVLQYADGRQIGGVRLEVRHPQWREAKIDHTYDLWIRVIDGFSSRPLPEVQVDILHWDPTLLSPTGAPGDFRLGERVFSNGSGIIERKGRPSQELEAYVVRHEGYRSVVRCLRPLAGQPVRLHLRVWPLKRDYMRYTWKTGDRMDQLAALSGLSTEALLQHNRLTSANQLRAGMRIQLPFYSANYHMEPWDNFDWIGKAFGYQNAAGLARANGFLHAADLDGGLDIRLPGWSFFYAREGDTLDLIDKLFGLPKGSTITVGKAYHPYKNVPYRGETIAVPTAAFAKQIRKKK